MLDEILIATVNVITHFFFKNIKLAFFFIVSIIYIPMTIIGGNGVGINDFCSCRHFDFL